MTANATFYRKPFGGGGISGYAALGPFPAFQNLRGAWSPLLAGQGGQTNILAGSQPIRNVYSNEGMQRITKFPGVMRTERPARGVVAFPPLKEDLTNHSLVVLTDANLGPVNFELVTAGIPTPGNELVDLTAGGVTTAEQVAGIFAAAVNAYTLALATPPSGFIAKRVAFATNTVSLRQASEGKNFPGTVNGDHPQKLTWFTKTWGSLGNLAITTTDGTVAVAGFLGGKKRLPGILLVPHQKTPICLGVYYAEMKIEHA